MLLGIRRLSNIERRSSSALILLEMLRCLRRMMGVLNSRLRTCLRILILNRGRLLLLLLLLRVLLLLDVRRLGRLREMI